LGRRGGQNGPRVSGPVVDRPGSAGPRPRHRPDHGHQRNRL